MFEPHSVFFSFPLVVFLISSMFHHRLANRRKKPKKQTILCKCHITNGTILFSTFFGIWKNYQDVKKNDQGNGMVQRVQHNRII